MRCDGRCSPAPCSALRQRSSTPTRHLPSPRFRSPDALPTNMVGERFTVGALEDLASFAFRMVPLDSSVYSENFAPDLRFAALLAAALALCAVAPWRGTPAVASLKGSDWRLLA